MIGIDEEYADAEVRSDFLNRKTHTHMYSVKVSFTDIGFYINGITVEPSPKKPEEGLWVQLPRYKAAGKYRWPLEMSKSSPLWKLIERISRKAVEDYTATHDEVYMPDDNDFNNVADSLDDAIDGMFGDKPSSSI